MNVIPPLVPRVAVVIHAPRFSVVGGRKLREVFGWGDPDLLVDSYVRDVYDCSYAYAQYRIAERVEIDGFPVKADGFRYTAAEYFRCWQTRSGFHQPDAVDYLALLDELNIIAKINSGAIDEVWLMGFPYAGYYESIMAGPKAFWCNAPPLLTTTAQRRFVIMGFNYERGVGEMLEDLGHRAESIMARVFSNTRGQASLWERFTRYDKTHPGRAQCGNVHFAANSRQDYDWGNHRPVTSLCDDWLSYPDFQGSARTVNCSDWGNGDIRLHHLWWFKHFPHVAGQTAEGISNNWWSYVIEPDRVPV